MTREEAILVLDSLSTWLGHERFITEEIVEAIKTLSKSLLPSNLDEAAHSYSESEEPLYSPGHRFYWDSDSLFGKQIETTFKAGAKWQKEQMMKEAVECIVEDWNLEPHPEITIPLNPEEFSNGDKVRIIIVKEGWNVSLRQRAYL